MQFLAFLNAVADIWALSFFALLLHLRIEVKGRWVTPTIVLPPALGLALAVAVLA